MGYGIANLCLSYQRSISYQMKKNKSPISYIRNTHFVTSKHKANVLFADLVIILFIFIICVEFVLLLNRIPI